MLMQQVLESWETYVHLGFTLEGALHIWSKWVNLGEDFRQLTSFIQIAVDILDWNQRDAVCAADDWNGALSSYRICEVLKDAIMDPEYEQIRLTQTAKYWVTWVVTTRWEHLVAQFHPEVNRPPPKSAGTLHGHPDTTIIWKACGRSRAEAMWSYRPELGFCHLSLLKSAPPSTFSPDTSKCNFTMDLEAAQFEARFLQRIAGSARVCLVRIEIPNELIDRAWSVELRYPDEEFKSVVYHSHRQSPPSHFTSQVRNAVLILGHATRSSNKPLCRMSSSHEITLDNLFCLPGHTPGHPESCMTQFTFGFDLQHEI